MRPAAADTLMGGRRIEAPSAVPYDFPAMNFEVSLKRTATTWPFFVAG
jgi:hypothetical protein